MLRLVLACLLISAAPAAAAPKSSPKKPTTAAKKPVVASNTNTNAAPAPAPAAPAAATPAAAAPAAPAPAAAPKDPLEAALALAVANAAAPRVAPAAAPRPAAGIADLNKHARAAAKFGLGAGPQHSRDLPATEAPLQMQARTVDQKAIAQVVRADMRALQYCHESLSARGVKCGGDISLNFVIEPRGHVSRVKVSAGGANAARFEACIAARVKAWKFPAADAPTTVSYPLVLER